jgi:hypothetical protein
MAGQKTATRRHGEGSEEQALAFIDHHRQDYAEQVPVPHEGEFLIGDYGDYGDSGGVGELGEFKVVLHYLGDRRGMLVPQLCVFGDGAAAFAVLLGLVDGDLARLLRPVAGRDEFSQRLLDLGIRDASHTPLAEAR